MCSSLTSLRRNKAEGTHSGGSSGRYRDRSTGRSCGFASPQLKSGGGTPTFVTVCYDRSTSWTGYQGKGKSPSWS